MFVALTTNQKRNRPRSTHLETSSLYLRGQKFLVRYLLMCNDAWLHYLSDTFLKGKQLLEKSISTDSSLNQGSPSEEKSIEPQTHNKILDVLLVFGREVNLGQFSKC